MQIRMTNKEKVHQEISKFKIGESFTQVDIDVKDLTGWERSAFIGRSGLVTKDGYINVKTARTTKNYIKYIRVK
jgi:hypothetical protein